MGNKARISTLSPHLFKIVLKDLASAIRQKEEEEEGEERGR